MAPGHVHHGKQHHFRTLPERLQLVRSCVMVRLMDVSLEFLRGVLGVLGIYFAHLAGRSGAQVRKGAQKPARFYGWLVRAAACVVVLSIRHPLGALDYAIWAICAAAFGLGWWGAMRARPEEDLTHEMFPK